MDNDKYLTQECTKCFLMVDVALGEVLKDPYMCDYCSSNKEMTEKELLERRLEVLENTMIIRFPVTLKQMYRVLKEIKL